MRFNHERSVDAVVERIEYQPVSLMSLSTIRSPLPTEANADPETPSIVQPPRSFLRQTIVDAVRGRTSRSFAHWRWVNRQFFTRTFLGCFSFDPAIVIAYLLNFVAYLAGAVDG